MSAITEILYDRIKNNNELIGTNTDLIAQLLVRIIELEKHIPEPPAACAELSGNKTPLP